MGHHYRGRLYWAIEFRGPFLSTPSLCVDVGRTGSAYAPTKAENVMPSARKKPIGRNIQSEVFVLHVQGAHRTGIRRL